MSREKRGKQNRAEGREAGRWMREDGMEARNSPAVPARATQGAETRDNVPDWLGGSFDLDGAHGVGAGKRRQRRQLVQPDGQGVRARDAGSGLAEGAWPTAGRQVSMGRASSGSVPERSDIWRSFGEPAGRGATVRSRSSGSRSRKAMAGRDRWVFRRSRTGSCRRRSKLVIEPIFEVRFRPTSYGFRPGRGCKDALREVDRLLEEGYCYVVDADLKSYFDSIPHERLMERVEDAYQRWARAWPCSRLPRAGHPAGDGTMDADGGHAARCGDQPAAGQHLPAPAG